MGNRRRTNATRWRVDDAIHAQTIGRIRHNSQVRQRITHDAAIIKARLLFERVRHFGMTQGGFQRTAHMLGTIQHRDVVGRASAPHDVADRFGDGFGFHAVIKGFVDHEGWHRRRTAGGL